MNKVLKQGLFISFEGGEGAGKSTIIKLVANRLSHGGYKVKTVREPGGSKISESIREITHNTAYKNLDYRAEALLFAAARAQLVREVYSPFLAKKYIVLADRYIDSSYAYQGYGRGLGFEPVRAINDFAIEGLLPKLTIILDISHEAGHKRRHGTAKVDRLDLETKEFYQKVHHGYHELEKMFKDRIHLLDASQDIRVVLRETMGLIERLIEKIDD